MLKDTHPQMHVSQCILTMCLWIEYSKLSVRISQLLLCSLKNRNQCSRLSRMWYVGRWGHKQNDSSLTNTTVPQSRHSPHAATASANRSKQMRRWRGDLKGSLWRMESPNSTNAAPRTLKGGCSMTFTYTGSAVNERDTSLLPKDNKLNLIQISLHPSQSVTSTILS